MCGLVDCDELEWLMVCWQVWLIELRGGGSFQRQRENIAGKLTLSKLGGLIGFAILKAKKRKRWHVDAENGRKGLNEQSVGGRGREKGMTSCGVLILASMCIVIAVVVWG